MLNLDSNTSLHLLTTIAGDIRVSGSTVDINPTTNPVGFIAGSITLAPVTAIADTPIVTSPAATHTRNVKQLTIRNNGTAAHPLKVSQVNGANTTFPWEGTLSPGNWVTLNENGNWIVYDKATGAEIDGGTSGGTSGGTVGGITASSTDTFTNKTIDAEGTGNAITNLKTSNLKAGVLVTDLSTGTPTDLQLASAKATKDALAAQGDMSIKGTWNASTNTPALVSGTGTKGFAYTVSVAGTTTIDGISSWDAEDLIHFDGTVWRKLLGKKDVNVSTALVFAAGNTPAQNIAQLQNALNLGGVVNIAPNQGEVLINDMFVVRSNTTINGAGGSTVLKLAPNTNKNILQNQNWGSVDKVITAITITNPVIKGYTTTQANVTSTAHGKSVGDYVFIHGCTPDTYNGVFRVESVADANTFAYRICTSTTDPIAAAAGTELPFIQTTNTSTANTLTTTSGSTAVTGTGFVAGAAWVGKSLYTVTYPATGAAAGTVVNLGVIQSVASSTSLTLVAGATATVASGKWSIMNPAGMWFCDADRDITLNNLHVDYDGENQTTPDTYLKHGIYLRRVGNLKVINCKGRNVFKYAFAIANAYGCMVDSNDMDTFSDGIHIMGSGDNITVSNNTGKVGDDFVAVGPSDYYSYTDPGFIIGNFGEVVVENNKPRRGLTATKYFGCLGSRMANLVISNSGGTISGGAATIVLVNDAAVFGAEAGGSTIDKVSITLRNDNAGTKPAMTVSNKISVRHLAMPEFVAGIGNTLGFSNGILINGGAFITNAMIGLFKVFSSSGTFANNAYGIRCDSTSGFYKINIGTANCESINGLLQMGTTGNVANSCFLQVGTLMNRLTDYACVANGRVNVMIGLMTRDGVTGSTSAFSFGDFSVLEVGRAWGYDGTDQCLVGAGKNLQINAPDIGIDIGAKITQGAGVIVRQRKSSFFNVSLTGATNAGTLERFNTVYFNTTNNTWVQSTNLALTA